MNQQELDKRIEAVNNQMIAEEAEVGETIQSPRSTDLLQEQRNTRYNNPVPQYRGAKPSMQVDFSMLEDSVLPTQFKRAKRDSEYYTAQGDRTRASQIKQQYMEDYFLPTVDAMVRMNSMEAVLANPAILAKLDAYTLLDGTNGSGYTNTYIRNFYASTGKIEASDGKVRRGVLRIRALAEEDQNRLAIAEAKQLLDAIDRGENIATSEDYEFVAKIALS